MSGLSGRTVLVTGATPGSLGHATAKALVDAGADVVVTARTAVDEAVRASGGRSGHPLDLSRATSVEAFSAWYAREVGRLDVLVNNAGIHLDLRSRWQEPHLTPDGEELHWRTNYLGTAHLTARMLPLLEAAQDARVVHVVSKLHARGRNDGLFAALSPYDSWVAYGTSKLALVHHAGELSRRHPDVTAVSLHPGSVYTHIADRGLEGHRVLSRLRKAFAPLERRALLSPEQGARTTVHCATAPDLVPGGYYVRSVLTEPSDDAQDQAAAARLWVDTELWLSGLAGAASSSGPGTAP
jgi:NAD(P)-dependent dehydrogenase (short-subunit alcohol dehydrogenase family)